MCNLFMKGCCGSVMSRPSGKTSDRGLSSATGSSSPSTLCGG